MRTCLSVKDLIAALMLLTGMMLVAGQVWSAEPTTGRVLEPVAVVSGTQAAAVTQACDTEMCEPRLYGQPRALHRQASPNQSIR